MSYRGGRTIYIDSDGNEHFDYERDYEPKPITNYDRIISKTPEELAEFLIQDGDCPPERIYPDSCPNCDRVTPIVCYGCWLDWLKQEVRE